MRTVAGDALTIVVPTQDRPRLLRRCLDYYAALPHAVVVVDGSRQPCREAEGRTGVDYQHLPGADPWTRMAHAMERVHTPYCVASPDDDFLLPDGLERCVAVLETRPHCVSVQGIYAEYRIESRSRMDVGLKYVPAYRNHLFARAEPGNAVERVERLMQHFVQYVWAMHRTEHLSYIVRAAHDGGPIALTLVELLFSLLSAVRGETVLVPALYCLRDVTPSRVAPGDKACTYPLSEDPQRRLAHARLLDAVCAAGGVELEAVHGASQVSPRAASVRDWLDAVLRDWASDAARGTRPAGAVPDVAPRRFRDPVSGVRGTFESAAGLADGHAAVEAFYPALRLVQRDFRPEERFRARFGLPPVAPRRSVVRALARRLGIAP